MTTDDNLNLVILGSALFNKMIKIDSGKNKFEMLDLNNSDWNQPLIDAVWLFFECGARQFDLNPDDCVCCQLYNIDALLNQKIILDQLYNKIIRVICEYVYIGDTGVRNLCINALNEETRFAIDSFGFNMDIAPSGSRIIVDAYSKKYGIMNFLTDQLRPFFVFTDRCTLIGLNGETCHILFASEVGNVRILNGKEVVTLTYTIKSIVNSFDKDCYDESNTYDCYINRILSFIVNGYRDCVPLKYSRNNATSHLRHLPYCNSTDYRSNLFNFDIEDQTTV